MTRRVMCVCCWWSQSQQRNDPAVNARQTLPSTPGTLRVTSAVMLAACLPACIGPTRRALRLNPIDALREARTLKANCSPAALPPIPSDA